jgi:transcriptional regulator with XRE-family HTH domain
METFFWRLHMAPRPAPTVKRRRLAQELRSYREAAGLTIEQVAARLEWSAGKISKIENARVGVLPRDVKFLLGVYGIDEAAPEREALLTMARESRQRGWWQQYGDAIAEYFEVYVGLESAATSLATYQGEYVPGMLQTRDYARAVCRAFNAADSDDEIERRVKARIARQEGLTGPEGLELWVVLNEAVLRRLVGSRAVMHAQLAQLVGVGEAANVTLQVLPFSAGAHPVMDSPFALLGFEATGDPEIVYLEYPTGALYLERQEEVARYRRFFDELRATALSVAESRRLVTRAAEELA